MVQIAWYPGHMNKAKRLMAESLKLIDVAVELRDARIPASSTNPDIAIMLKDKLRLVLLNKKDFADHNRTKIWLDYLNQSKINADAVSCIDRNDIIRIKSRIFMLCEERRLAFKERKGINKTTRIMVMGIPNVGKSTFINRLIGEKKAKVEDRPGVTRGNQWVRLDQYIELLDTPGLLWPKLAGRQTPLHLAYTGSIRAETMDALYIAHQFLQEIVELYPKAIIQRYGLDSLEFNSEQILEQICIRMGCLKPGGIADVEAGAKRLMREFQTGKLGKITLELP